MSASVTPRLDDPAEIDALFAPVAAYPAIGLAVSGGADSLALMLLAQSWASAAPGRPRLQVYSVDHGLRPEAAGEVAMVLAAAKALGIAATGLRWEGDKPKTGVQEAARIARYRLMGAAMAADGVPALLTAHHRNDQAETLLMRLAHGSGIEGLKGMAPVASVENVRVYRPLLNCAPGDLHDLVLAAGLVPAQDSSNHDEHYERVRWRKALPQLAELGLDAETLARFALRMGEADAAIARVADEEFAALVVLDGFGSARLELATFVDLSPAVATRVLGRVLKIVGGRQKPRALGLVERLQQTLYAGGAGKGVTALGCVVRTHDGAIIVAREPGRALPRDAAIPPHSQLLWDERFLIINNSDMAGITAGIADYLPRHRLQEFLGFKVTAPAEAIRTAPIVRNAEGGVLSLGGWSFDERIEVQLLID